MKQELSIRGLRGYVVEGIPKDSIGGKEWHRARTEYVQALSGQVLWECVDIKGKKRVIELDGSQGVLQPPGILHTYHALEDNTTLQVICNTLFIPEDPRTHDTFSQEDFRALREHIANQ